MEYLKHLNKNGVVNIEMEVLPFFALTHQAGIRSAVINVALLNRLNGDQVIIITHEGPRRFYSSHFLTVSPLMGLKIDIHYWNCFATTRFL